MKLTEEATEFINTRAKTDHPFFLFYTPDASHGPVYSSMAFKNKSKRGLIGDAIQELDWSVGQLLETLDKNGIRENTLVVFSSDNGAACVGPLEQSGTNGPLLCCKQTTFDGGMRVPGILSWPGTIKNNQVSSHVGSLMDLFATALDVAGLSVPTDRIIDGKSLMEVVKYEPTAVFNLRRLSNTYFGTHHATPNHHTGTHFFYRGNTLGAVRYGNYKMHIYTWSGATASSKVHFTE